MILNATVTVQQKTTTYDSIGAPITVWTAVQTTEKANKQPLSGEIAFESYGISESGISNLFFMRTTTAAQENGRVVDTDDTYEIRRIEKYPNHYEVIVKPVTGSG